jgi:peptidoglycan hydrolase-like protein with peptidoglycan-binding domain
LFGPATRDAVARYQVKKNLSVTGSLSSDTLQALGLPQVATNSTTPPQ